MTPFTLSSTTIAAINTALAGGVNGTPGTDNINFVTTYAARRRRQSAKGKPDPMPRVFQPSSGNARTV